MTWSRHQRMYLSAQAIEKRSRALAREVDVSQALHALSDGIEALPRGAVDALAVVRATASATWGALTDTGRQRWLGSLDFENEIVQRALAAAHDSTGIDGLTVEQYRDLVAEMRRRHRAAARLDDTRSWNRRGWR